MPNEIELRNVAFEVHDLDAAVDRVTSAGYGLVGGIGSTRTLGGWPTSEDPKGSLLRLPADRLTPRRGGPFGSL
jgi:predicted enzyme related to lactoylglutathione lyase